MSPSDWKTTPFEDLVEFHDRHRVPLSKKERRDRSGPFPYYGAQGIIDWIDDYIFDGRYLLIAEDGENLRSRKQPVAYMAHGQFWVNNHAHVVKAVPGISDDDFLRAYVECSPLGGLITGVAQPKLSQSSLKRLPVIAPRYDTQVRIGQAIRAVDGMLEANRCRIGILEKLARLLYREWFVHFRFPGHGGVKLIDSELGRIPEGWEVVSASVALEVNPKLRVEKDQECRFITMGDLSESSMDCRPSEVKSANSGAKFQNGDTLFARITPCLENGKIAFVQCLGDGEIGRGSTEFIVFRGRHLSPECTYLLGREDDFRHHAIKSMTGASGRQRVRNECFDSYFLALPPRTVIDRFSEIATPMFRLIARLSDQNAVLNEIRSLILPRLVSGEFDVSAVESVLEPVTM